MHPTSYQISSVVVGTTANYLIADEQMVSDFAGNAVGATPNPHVGPHENHTIRDSELSTMDSCAGGCKL
jgi:hypothetical protein